MKILLTSLLIIALLNAFSIYGKDYEVSSMQGMYDGENIGERSEKSAFNIEFEITKYTEAIDWPSAAYTGFYEGEFGDNSFQFFVIRNSPAEKYVVAGYRVIADGKEIEQVTLKQLGLTERISLKLSIENGTVSIEIEGIEPIQVQTKLKKVMPYISTSSSDAVFSVST